jgi:hypothetical protein
MPQWVNRCQRQKNMKASCLTVLAAATPISFPLERFSCASTCNCASTLSHRALLGWMLAVRGGRPWFKRVGLARGPNIYAMLS